MSSQEFTQWIAYNNLDPIGDVRQDYNAALIARTIAQVNAKKGKVYKLEDFKLDFEGPEKMKDPKDIMNFFRLLSKK